MTTTKHSCDRVIQQDWERRVAELERYAPDLDVTEFHSVCADMRVESWKQEHFGVPLKAYQAATQDSSPYTTDDLLTAFGYSFTLALIAMSHAIKSGREEFAEHLGSIRDLVVDAEVDAGFDRRPNDELNDWMKHRYGKTKKRIPTSRMT